MSKNPIECLWLRIKLVCRVLWLCLSRRSIMLHRLVGVKAEWFPTYKDEQFALVRKNSDELYEDGYEMIFLTFGVKKEAPHA